jgi:sRNA-binding regulator protein Hfq
LKQNRIARIEITAFFVNGKKIKAKKIYETYCYFDNYEGGKKSNRVNDMSAEEEYENVVSKRLLKNE